MNFSHGSYEVSCCSESKLHVETDRASITNRSLTMPKRPNVRCQDVHWQLPSTLQVSRQLDNRLLTIEQKGPEIRTGNTPGDQDIPIKAGHVLNITTDDKYATASDDKNM
jgi:Pyruvate kinase, barrel domain